MSININSQAVTLFTTSLGIDLLLNYVLDGTLLVKVLGEKIKDDLYNVDNLTEVVPFARLGQYIKLTEDMGDILTTALPAGRKRLLLVIRKTDNIVAMFDVSDEIINNKILPMAMVGDQQTFNIPTNTKEVIASAPQSFQTKSAGGLQNTLSYILANPSLPEILPSGDIVIDNNLLGKCSIRNIILPSYDTINGSFHKVISTIVHRLPGLHDIGNLPYSVHDKVINQLVALYVANFQGKDGVARISYPNIANDPDWIKLINGKTITTTINGDNINYEIKM